MAKIKLGQSHLKSGGIKWFRNFTFRLPNTSVRTRESPPTGECASEITFIEFSIWKFRVSSRHKRGSDSSKRATEAALKRVGVTREPWAKLF